MTEKYILALDQGTSSSRAILFDKNAKTINIEQQEFNQFYPKTDWVEQNADEIFNTQLSVAKKLIKKSKIDINKIAAIGITNQRETTVVWDKNTGKPIYNAIVWQDKRTARFCKSKKTQKLYNYIKLNTGLIIDSYFSATKVHWILNNVPQAKQKARKGELLFGTIDTWLIWKLTNGKLHITDFSNASRTMLFNIKTLEWDKKLLDFFDIPISMLPKVVNSSDVYGETDKNIFGQKIKISGIAGDQQAALFGQTCFNTGEAKNTYGTGCFMLMNTGNKFVSSKNGLLTTIAWGLNGKITYALEGSVFIAGALIKWLRDNLKIIKSAYETEEIAKSVSNNNNVYFVPAFSGLGAPYWNMNAKGAIVGLTQSVEKTHIIRAALESLAYQTKDIFNVMQKDSEINLQNLNVDGGASVNNFLMQFQADILDAQINRPENTESTALGAAYLAGLAVDFWTINDIKQIHKIEKSFIPKIDEKARKKLYSGWKNAVKIINS